MNLKLMPKNQLSWPKSVILKFSFKESSKSTPISTLFEMSIISSTHNNTNIKFFPSCLT